MSGQPGGPGGSGPQNGPPSAGMGGPPQQTGGGQAGGGPQGAAQGSSISQQNLNSIVGHQPPYLCLVLLQGNDFDNTHLPTLVLRPNPLG
jgi:hypothetical protein